MKKAFILSSLLLLSSFIVFAYTQTDADSATYLAAKGIITQQSTTTGYRLDDKITRAEVMGTALKMKWVVLPEGYICQKKFSDATANDWICRAAELAAEHGLISQTNTTARPHDNITRAEAFSILFQTQSFPAVSIIAPVFGDTDMVDWQKNLFRTLVSLKIGIPNSITSGTLIVKLFVYPNRLATRGEVFTFAKNTLEARALVSGEVTVQ